MFDSLSLTSIKENKVTQYVYIGWEKFEDIKEVVWKSSIDEGQTTQWPNEKWQKAKQWYTKHDTVR